MIKFAQVINNTVVNIIVGDESFNSAGYVRVTESTRDAHIGSTYDFESNKFIDFKPWDSWIFNEETYEWESPLGEAPQDGVYRWDEESLTWIKLS